MAERLDAHPDWTVSEALYSALLTEAFLYGVPGAQSPTGLLGRSPLTPAPEE